MQAPSWAQSFLLFADELRGSLRLLALSLAGLTLVFFFISSGILVLLQGHLNEKLYFFSVAGPFLAHVQIAFCAALYVLMPLFMRVLWQALGKPFGITGKKLSSFVLATCLLFYTGTIFCYLVTLPFGVNFLLSFQSAALQPVISISRFVDFVTLFIFAFGLVFELPVYMIFTTLTGLLSRQFYERNRRYAILIIAVLAATLTPTPDAVNMALMGLPLYLLYESGILLIRLCKLERPRSLAE